MEIKTEDILCLISELKIREKVWERIREQSLEKYSTDFFSGIIFGYSKVREDLERLIN